MVRSPRLASPRGMAIPPGIPKPPRIPKCRRGATLGLRLKNKQAVASTQDRFVPISASQAAKRSQKAPRLEPSPQP
jgi:hypothetical protein